MSEQIEKIVNILHKLMNDGELSETEKTDLDTWRSRSAYNEQLYNEILYNPEIIQQEMKFLLKNKSTRAIWNKINRQLSDQGHKPISIFRNKSFRYAVAAALVILLGLSSYFIFTNSAPNSELPTSSISHQPPVKSDIPPGSDGAVLTLSDGKQIILDNTGKGEIAQEGSARVIKSDDGQLVYQLSGNDHSGSEARYNTVSTPIGKQYRVSLPDGSKVYLNSASSIKYPAVFTGNERRVIVTGELYFEVAKDKYKPFRVAIASQNAGEGRNEAPGEIEVLGTSFNLNAYPEENSINTTLVEGLVKISNKGKTSFIKPGQQARISSQGDIKIVSNADVEQIVAWKNGLFLFKKDNLETIMRQISRWYGAEVVFEDKITEHFVGTLPRKEPVSKVLGILEMAGGVHFEINGNKIIVRR